MQRDIIKETNELSGKIIAFVEIQSNDKMVKLMMDENPVLRKLFFNKYLDIVQDENEKKAILLAEQKQAQQTILMQNKLEEDYKNAEKDIKNILAEIHCNVETSEQDMRKQLFTSQLNKDLVENLIKRITKFGVKYKHLELIKIQQQVEKLVQLRDILNQHPMLNNRMGNRDNKFSNKQNRNFPSNDNENDDENIFDKPFKSTGNISDDINNLLAKINSNIETPNMEMSVKLQEANLTMDEKELRISENYIQKQKKSMTN